MTDRRRRAGFSDGGAEARNRPDLVDKIQENSPVVMFSLDPITMQTVYITPNVERILGYTKDEIASVPDFWRAHVHPDDLTEYLRLGEAASAARAPQLAREYRFRHKSGEYRWLQAIAKFSYDSAGPVSRIGYLADVTDRKKADSEIAFQATILAQIHDAVIVTDRQFRVVYINPAAELLYRIGARESLGNPLAALGAGFWSKEAEFATALKSVEATGGWQGRGMQTRHDGSSFFAAMTMSPFKDPRGSGGGYLCIIRDESAQQQLEQDLRESQENLLLLADSAADGVAMTVGPQFVVANPALLRLFGVSSVAELQDSKWLELVHPEDRPRLTARWSAIMAGQPVSRLNEFRLVDQQGDSRVVEVNVSQTIYHGEPAGISVVRDITERRRAEEILLLNQELAQRVAERTAQLEAANEELEAFSYSVSHDLRAPLRSIDGFSQALLEDYAGALDELGRDYLQRVRASTQRMGRLIDDLLALSRVTRSEMRRETVSLSALAESVAEALQQAEPQREVEIAVQPDLLAKGDPQLLRILLVNLLSNAWKFTGRQPKALIEFGATNNGGGAVSFFVRDNGAGFDMAYADKLFEAFQRLHSPSEFPGTGIGLATVRRIVHRHGGEVSAEGAPGQGAMFSFTLSA